MIVAELIENGMQKARRTLGNIRFCVTKKGAKKVKSSEFAAETIKNM